MSQPEERDFFGSLNVIKTLVESTCRNKWEILVETAFPAAGKALYILIIPSPSEILENYLQPRGGRGRSKGGPHPHGRRQNTRFGRLRWWQKIGFPDIDAIIAQQLPGRDLFEGRTAGKAEQFFWFGVDVLDRGLWYWMLLDIAEDFTVNWASGIMESRFCTSPMDALFIGSGQGYPPVNSGPLWNTPDKVTVEDNADWFLADNGTITRINPLIGVSGTIICTFQATRKLDAPDRPTHCQLLVTVDHLDAPSSEILSNIESPERGQSFSLQCQASLKNVIAIHFSIRLTGASFVVPLEDVQWTAQAWCTPD